MKRKNLVKLVRDALLVTYGFAPPLPAIVIVDSFECGGKLDYVGFSVHGRGYLYVNGYSVSRDAEFDLY